MQRWEWDRSGLIMRFGRKCSSGNTSSILERLTPIYAGIVIGVSATFRGRQSRQSWVDSEKATDRTGGVTSLGGVLGGWQRAQIWRYRGKRATRLQDRLHEIHTRLTCLTYLDIRCNGSLHHIIALLYSHRMSVRQVDVAFSMHYIIERNKRPMILKA